MPLTEPTVMGLGTTTRSRAVLALQRALLRAPRWLWRPAMAGLARAALWAVTRGEREAGGYVRGSLSGTGFHPGLSDLDLAVVADDEAAAVRVRARGERLRSRFPLLPLVLDVPMALGERDLAAIVGTTTLTYDGAAYGGSWDPIRALEVPGLDGQTAGWWHVYGPHRRPASRRPDVAAAAWLELVYRWRWAYPACASPPGPRLAAQCVKLVSEPGRAWLALQGVRPASREEVLAELLRRRPQDETALLSVIAVQGTLHRSPQAPLADAIRLLVELSEAIAASLEQRWADAPRTDVRLVGADGRAPYGDEATTPLADWRAVVCPGDAGATLQVVEADPAEPAVLGMLARRDGPYPAIRHGRLLLLPGANFLRTRMRTVQTSLTDPVSFALLRGEDVARFPDVPGFSARDLARRAVAEHAAGADPPAAARAHAFAASLDAEPELSVRPAP